MQYQNQLSLSKAVKQSLSQRLNHKSLSKAVKQKKPSLETQAQPQPVEAEQANPIEPEQGCADHDGGEEEEEEEPVEEEQEEEREAEKKRKKQSKKVLEFESLNKAASKNAWFNTRPSLSKAVGKRLVRDQAEPEQGCRQESLVRDQAEPEQGLEAGPKDGQLLFRKKGVWWSRGVGGE